MNASRSAQDVLEGRAKWSIECCDCVEFMQALPENSADLIFGSPPYMDARTYGIDCVYDCQQWVDWMLSVTEAAVRVSKGLVLWVCSGVQRDLCYWPGCEGLAWEWWKRGNQLWRPVIWHKVDEEGGGTGIPGSGGKQWLRNDWEYVLAFKKEGWLPWADNTAMGHEPVCDKTGGEMSNRTEDGRRINARPGVGVKERREEWGDKGRTMGKTRRSNGEYKEAGRPMPKIANPGNFLSIAPDDLLIVNARVGGGHIGDRMAHEGEAPFPEKLAEFFVRSFCPPEGIVLDCFSGTGTTAKMAVGYGRRFLGCDLRQSQVDLTKKRLDNVTLPLFAEQS